MRLFVNLGTVAHQAALSMGFPRQKHWSGLPFPPPWDLLDPGIELICVSCIAGGFFTAEPPEKPCIRYFFKCFNTLAYLTF